MAKLDYVTIALLVGVIAVGWAFASKSFIALLLCICAAGLCIWNLMNPTKKVETPEILKPTPAKNDDKMKAKEADSKIAGAVQAPTKPEGIVRPVPIPATARVSASSGVAPTAANMAAASASASASASAPTSSSSAAPPVSANAAKPTLTREEQWGVPSFRVRDYNRNLVQVNSEEPVPFESPYFKGKILFMARTEGEYERFNRYRDHFKGVRRKFEIQVQGTFKLEPKGMVMMGGELPHKIEMGLMTRTLVSMMMKFCSRLIANMSFGFGEDATPDGNYEKPFICFPMYRAMDRVVVTPTGETPPDLGKELPEEDKVRSARRGGKSPDLVFEVGPTYSFSFHSMYIDFVTWSMCNVAGYKHISFDSFLGKVPCHIVVYEFDKNASGGKHTVNSKRYLSDLELTHESMVPKDETYGNVGRSGTQSSVDSNNSSENLDGGVLANNGEDNYETGSAPATPPPETITGGGNNTSTLMSVEAQYLAANSGGAGSGSVLFDDYGPVITSGMTVPFVALPLAWEVDGGVISSSTGAKVSSSHSSSHHNSSSVSAGMDTIDDEIYSIRGMISPGSSSQLGSQNSQQSNMPLSWYYMGIGEHDGQAVRWRIPYSHNMRLIKISSGNEGELGTTSAGGSTPASPAPQDEVIRSGDVVMVQSVTSSYYLGAYRGFYLTWSQSSPTDTKGHFIISLVDATTGRLREGREHGEAIVGTQLQQGMPFRLRSARWPAYEVGIENSSANLSGSKKTSSSSSSFNHSAADGTRHMDCLVLYEWAMQCPLLAPRGVYLKASKSSASHHAASKHSAHGSSAGGHGTKTAYPLYICGISYPRTPLSLITSLPAVVSAATEATLQNPSSALTLRHAAPTAANLPQFENNLHVQTIALLNFMSNQQIVSDGSKATSPLKSNPGNPSKLLLDTELDINIIGWVDLVHRTTCVYEIAYVLKISLTFKEDPQSAAAGGPGEGDNNGGISEDAYTNKWCIIRSGQEIDSMLCLLETFDKRYSSSSSTGNVTGGNSNSNLVEVIPKQHETMISQVQKLLCYRLRKCLLNKALRNSIEFQKIIGEFVLKPNIYDSWFLSGGIMQLFPPALISAVFLPAANNGDKATSSAHSGSSSAAKGGEGNGLLTCSVARALWDGEWREEVAVLTPEALYFYIPVALNTTGHASSGNFSRYCSKKILIQDIGGVSHVYSHESPLPGFQILRIETIGRVHYVAFNNTMEKERMMIELSQQINNMDLLTIPGLGAGTGLHNLTSRNSILSNNSANLAAAHAANAAEIERFVLRSRQWTPSSQLVLNARVFAFDKTMLKLNMVIGRGGSNEFRSNSGTGEAVSTAAPAPIKRKENESLCDISIRLLNSIQNINLSIAMRAKTRMLMEDAQISHDDCAHIRPLEFGCMHESSRTLLNVFLMDICELKNVNLHEVDLKSTETLCFFVNIYHTLLLHARLVLGRPNKMNWSSFFSDACYEIGNDVFSLVELEHCVVKGLLASPHPHAVKKGHVLVKLPSQADDHFMYSVAANSSPPAEVAAPSGNENSAAAGSGSSSAASPTVDRRVHFLINNGSLSCPSKIFVMRPQLFEKICVDASQAYLADSISVDVRRHTIYLPRILDIYRNDFGDDNISILQTVRSLVDFTVKNEIQDVIQSVKSTSSIVIKFQKSLCESRKNLELQECS